LPESEIHKDIQPLKLPGQLGQMTGTVMYPDESSAKWDVDGRFTVVMNVLSLKNKND